MGIVPDLLVDLLQGLAEFFRADLVRVLVIIGVDHDGVGFFGLDNTVCLGLELLAHLLFGDVAKATTLSINALDEFAEVLWPTVPDWQRAEGKGGGRIERHDARCPAGVKKRALVVVA